MLTSNQLALYNLDTTQHQGVATFTCFTTIWNKESPTGQPFYLRCWHLIFQNTHIQLTLWLTPFRIVNAFLRDLTWIKESNMWLRWQMLAQELSYKVTGNTTGEQSIRPEISITLPQKPEDYPWTHYEMVRNIKAVRCYAHMFYISIFI